MTRRAAATLLVGVVFLNSGCLVRKFRIRRKGATANAKLLSASLQELLERVRSIDEQVRTINATVDLEPSLGSVNKGQIDELKDVRAFVMIRKPGLFRMIGLYPVVRNRAFDMVTDGLEFKIHFPSRNRMVTGRNRLEKPSEKKLENIRPQHIFDALVIRPPGPDEHPVLENLTDENEASYILHILRRDGQQMVLDRNYWFERTTLRVVRQVIFDGRGNISTDARYEDYENEKGLQFPRRFIITRPIDEYGVKLIVKKLELNTQLDDDKFSLTPPPGTEVISLIDRTDGSGGAR